MKHLKTLALAGLTMAAVLGTSGTASATIVTSPAGTALTKGAVIKAEGSGTVSNSLVHIQCTSVSGQGELTDAGSATETPKGQAFLGTWSGCGDWVVTVLKTGTAEVHTEGGSANGNGTLTTTGAEVTAQHTSGLHCIFTTSGTDIGKVIGGTPATVQLSGTISRTGGRSGVFCGSTVKLSGSMTVTSPSPLFID